MVNLKNVLTIIIWKYSKIAALFSKEKISKLPNWNNQQHLSNIMKDWMIFYKWILIIKLKLLGVKCFEVFDMNVWKLYNQ